MPRERKKPGGAVREAVVRIPEPMPHQVAILRSPARFKLVCAGRRFGKTLTGLCAVVAGHGPKKAPLRGAVQGGTIWWVSPTYGMATIIWDDLKYSLRGAWIDKSEMERRIVLPGGGSVTVKSSDNPDLLRGAGLDGVVVDEAAMCVSQTWHEALRPALADKRGWGLLITTPRGQNWFYELWQQAEGRAGWETWQSPTAANPKVAADEIEEARQTLPPEVFLQEFEAQFVREAGSVFHRQWFRYYRDDGRFRIITDPDGERRIPYGEGALFVTVDLAVSQKTTADYFCAGVWQQLPTHELLLLDLVRDRIQGPDQVPLLQQLCQRYPVSWIALEAVAHQLAVVQEAVRAGLPARGVRPDRDKVARANLTASKYRAGQVYHRLGAPWLGTLEEELLGFPHAPHDDTVDMIGLAAQESADSWSGVREYYSRLRERSAASV